MLHTLATIDAARAQKIFACVTLQPITTCTLNPLYPFHSPARRQAVILLCWRSFQYHYIASIPFTCTGIPAELWFLLGCLLHSKKTTLHTASRRTRPVTGNSRFTWPAGPKDDSSSSDATRLPPPQGLQPPCAGDRGYDAATSACPPGQSVSDNNEDWVGLEGGCWLES